MKKYGNHLSAKVENTVVTCTIATDSKLCINHSDLIIFSYIMHQLRLFSAKPLKHKINKISSPPCKFKHNAQ